MTRLGPISTRESAEQKFGGAIAAYDSYVWMLHTHDFPADLESAERSLEVDPEQARFDAITWAEQDPTTVSRRLANQLNFVLRLVIGPANITRDHEVAQQRGLDKVAQLCLTGIVGTIVMEGIRQEDWYRTNPRLAQLENPFANDGLLEFFWRTQWRRSSRIPENILVPPISTIAPGYYA